MVKTRQRIEAIGLPGKPPGSPIFLDSLGNRLGDFFENRRVGDRPEEIPDKDIKKDITKNLEGCLRGERKREALFRGPSPWVKLPHKTRGAS